MDSFWGAERVWVPLPSAQQPLSPLAILTAAQELSVLDRGVLESLPQSSTAA